MNIIKGILEFLQGWFQRDPRLSDEEKRIFKMLLDKAIEELDK
jgi:hypothetical protein